MAKGNLFLGMGRGSVGDVTFYRANGQQLSRARNRAPRNPKSDAQLIQRAISATISQAYKAGKVIFDHAFEGKEVPGGNQRRFLSVNMRKIRNQIISEINEADLDKVEAAVVSPGSTYPVPNSYRISEGSLIQNLFEIHVDSSAPVNVGPVAKMVAALTNETVAEYAARLGLVKGEIYTIVCFGIPYNTASDDMVSPQSSFGFMRLIVKDVSSSTTAMASATFADFFTIDSSGATMPDSQPVSLGVNLDQILNGSVKGSMGVIRSNMNSGLRSTTDMVTPYGDDPSAQVNNWGVKAPLLLDAWADEANQVQSPLILEGGGF